MTTAEYGLSKSKTARSIPDWIQEAGGFTIEPDLAGCAAEIFEEIGMLAGTRKRKDTSNASTGGFIHDNRILAARAFYCFVL